MSNAAPAYLRFEPGNPATMKSAQDGQKVVTGNVPATVVGFEADDKARVVLMAPLFGLAAGSEVVASFKFVKKTAGSKPQDFGVLRKKGLRLGGIVMLMAAVEHDGGVLTKRIETLKPKPDLVEIRVLADMLCSILPPSDENSAMVEHALLAFRRDAVRVKTISAAISDIELALEEPCLYGPAGILLMGHMPDGEFVVHQVDPAGNRQPFEIVRDLVTSLPKDVSAAIRKTGAKAPWIAVPICRVDADPGRRPRLSAQFMNCEYGNTGDRFTHGASTLALLGDKWVLSDASPYRSPSKAASLDQVMPSAN